MELTLMSVTFVRINGTVVLFFNPQRWTSMKTIYLLSGVAAASLLVACGGGDSATNLGTVDSSPVRGALIQNPPPRTAFFTAGDFTAKLNASASGRNLLAIAGTPKCGVDVQYIK